MTDHICRDIYRGEQIALQVLNRELARDITHEEPYVVISITDPHGTHPRLALSENLRAVLPLQFSDVDRVWLHLQERSAYITSFTPEMARQVATFVHVHRQQGVCLFIVHCEAGISRSAGVAAALSRYYNADEQFFLHHYRPNPLVRQMVLKALRETE